MKKLPYTLSRVEIPGGFIAGDSIHAYLHDHQGNVRRVVNAHTGAVEQETHYYPFGMPFGESTATALRDINGSAMQPRRYGGKESVSLGAFTFLDFPARPYDAATARFLTPDPLQEDYTPFSPYLYCAANPMNLTDPTGMDVVIRGKDIDEATALHNRILKQAEDPLFGVIFQYMVQSDKTFYYQYGKITPPKGEKSSGKVFNGSFNPSTNTITISNTSLDDTTFSLTCAEESYHAFQTLMPEYNTNIEYEAHTFAMFHNFNMGSTFVPLDFAKTDYTNYDMYYEQVGETLRFNKSFFTQDFYIENGKKFIDHYNNSNISAYKDPVNKVPFRLFVLVQMLF